MEDARESADTVYFKDDFDSAAELVEQAEDMYAKLLATMPSEEAGLVFYLYPTALSFIRGCPFFNLRGLVGKQTLDKVSQYVLHS